MLIRMAIVALFSIAACPAIAAERGPGCAAKEAEIEANIAAATARGNKDEVNGLNKALRATKANCTEAGLKKEKEARIDKARREVAEREQDLAKAEKSGDVEKIGKRREKLAEARQELSAAEQ